MKFVFYFSFAIFDLCDIMRDALTLIILILKRYFSYQRLYYMIARSRKTWWIVILLYSISVRPPIRDELYIFPDISRIATAEITARSSYICKSFCNFILPRRSLLRNTLKVSCFLLIFSRRARWGKLSDVTRARQILHRACISRYERPKYAIYSIYTRAWTHVAYRARARGVE